MPYATPHSPHSPSVGSRPNHRRSYHSHVHSPTFTAEKGLGTFTSLGSLPRRRGPSKFKLHSESSDEDSDFAPPVTLRSKPPSFKLDVTGLLSPTPGGGTTAPPIPFPRSSPLPSPKDEHSPINPATRALRPSITRTASSPTIFLANGRPLKSSLKSSSSTGSVSGLAVQEQQIRHIRARSAPSTPRPGMVSEDEDEDDTPSPHTLTPSTPKNVHFASSLADVRVFNRSARPASVSLPVGSDFETETDEGESSSTQAGYFGWGTWSSPSSPIPPTGRSRSTSTPVRSGLGSTSIVPASRSSEPIFEVDSAHSSTLPLRSSNWDDRNIIMESVQLLGGVTSSQDSPKSNDGLHLSGTVLVRNISFEKSVTIRFTLDDWGTVSEVSAFWSAQIDSLPRSFVSAPSALTLGDLLVKPQVDERDKKGWDRFSFKIRLGDYTSTLTNKTLFMVGRFQAGGQGEWWDNNGGANYIVRFKEVPQQQPESELKVPVPKVATAAKPDNSTIPFPRVESPQVQITAPSPPSSQPAFSSLGATAAPSAGLDRQASSPQPLAPSPQVSPPLSSSPPAYPVPSSLPPPSFTAVSSSIPPSLVGPSPSSAPKPPPIVTAGPLTPPLSSSSSHNTPHYGAGSYQAGARPPAPPSPPNSITSPTAQATSKRLRGFSLSNWADPSKSRGRSGSVSSVGSSNSASSLSKVPEPETKVEEVKSEAAEEKKDDDVKEKEDDSSSSSDDEAQKSGEGSGDGEELTPPTSPLLDSVKDDSSPPAEPLEAPSSPLGRKRTLGLLSKESLPLELTTKSSSESLSTSSASASATPKAASSDAATPKAEDRSLAATAPRPSPIQTQLTPSPPQSSPAKVSPAAQFPLQNSSPPSSGASTPASLESPSGSPS